MPHAMYSDMYSVASSRHLVCLMEERQLNGVACVPTRDAHIDAEIVQLTE